MAKSPQAKRGQYTAPKIEVLTEQQVLEVFQVTTAGLSSWWMT